MMTRAFRSQSMITVLTSLTFCYSAQAQQPFNGSVASATLRVNVGDCFEEEDFGAAGTGVPLGQFSASGHQFVSYCAPPGEPDIEGDVTFTDENGDELSIHYTGSRLDPSTFICDMSATSGTGRYDGATVTATLVIDNYDLAHPFDGTFDGTIFFP